MKNQLHFGLLVDALVAPDAGEAGALLVQKNARDAVVLVGGERLVVLLLCAPSERLDEALARRVDDALSAEREAVLLGARQGVAAVILVDGPSLTEATADQQARLPAVAPRSHVVLEYLRLDLDRALSGDGAEAGAEAAAEGARLLEAAPLGADATHKERERRQDDQAPLEKALGEAVSRLRAGRVHAASREVLAASERAGEHTLATEGLFARRLDENIGLYVALIGALTLVWALQLAFGWGSSQTLYRMGSAWGHDVERGQWWRLVCAGWLHGNLGHLAGNAFGLVLFLGPVAAALGRRRAFLLFALSCAGGFLAATTFKPDDDGIGASGGVFGLMAALLCLGVRRRGDYLPRASGCGWALFAALYLGFNFVMSLKGGVSLLGHLGGAATGALLVLSGVITFGLAPLDGEGPRWGGALTHLATFAVIAVTVGALGTQWSRARPWVSRWPPPPVTVTFDDSPLSIDVPRSLMESNQQEDEGESHRYLIGRMRADPMVVSLIVRPRHPALPADDEAALAALVARYDRVRREQPPTAHPAAPAVSAQGDRRWVLLDESWSDDEGTRRRRFIRADGDREVDVMVIVDAEADPAWSRAAAAVVPTIHRAPR